MPTKSGPWTPRRRRAPRTRGGRPPVEGAGQELRHDVHPLHREAARGPPVDAGLETLKRYVAAAMVVGPHPLKTIVARAQQEDRRRERRRRRRLSYLSQPRWSW